MSYAELMVTSNFTFLTGASHPEELVSRAKELGLKAITVTDVNTFAGIVRGHAQAKEAGIQYLVGVCIRFIGGQEVLAFPKGRDAYGRLCRLLTVGKRRTVKGECDLYLEDLIKWGEGSILIIVPRDDDGDLPFFCETLHRAFLDHTYLGLAPHYDGLDKERFEATQKLAEKTGMPLTALGNVLMHQAARRMLADVLSCIREKVSIDNLGLLAQPNAERRLKSPFEMYRLFENFPEAIVATAKIAERCTFSLNELKYEYPEEITDGKDPDDRLRELTEAGLRDRYPDGEPKKIRDLVEKELKVIRQLEYAPFFLTVNDVVNFAKEKKILCQGRGSAANSAVCYAIGITNVGPEIISMVFERFVSEARGEPPDIDVDFEHERREEVIQHIYEKYGRHRAGICSTVVHFRSRAAIREVGKAMGLSEDAISAISSQVWGWSSVSVPEERVKQAGLDLRDRRLALTLMLSKELIGFPRHLSQHVGGFVICKGRLDELCPIENAAMEDRTVIEWDKDDIDVLGMLKVDVLSLGILTCLRKCFGLIASHYGTRYEIATLPQDDPDVYDQLCKGDSLGLFQVESRAQMSFLPRMRPRNLYDLVVEVAIVRPGPIQGDMVHPYLKRRKGLEKIDYYSEEMKEILKRTLGVPLFQEQALKIAEVAGGFDPGEADQFRRSLGSFRGPGSIEKFKDRFTTGAITKGYSREFAEHYFEQLKGFSGYGFPESHAASFALLAYASAWLRYYYPEVYCCAILNSQPMGFYAPAQLVRDAREHGVEVRPICINASYWDNMLEPDGRGGWALRLGFRQIKGFRDVDAGFIASSRGNGYREVEAVWRRAGVAPRALARLAEADAFGSLGISRRQALWEAKAIKGTAPLPLFLKEEGEGIIDLAVDLPRMSLGEEVFEDYVSTRLTLRAHPVQLLRPQLGQRTIRSSDLNTARNGAYVDVAGLVITRQRPGTASGVIFVTLEDEAGSINVIVWPKTFEQYRRSVMTGRLLKITGQVQQEDNVIHVISARIEDHSHLIDQLGVADCPDREIDPSWGNADEAKRPAPDRGLLGPASPARLPINAVSAGARHPREQAKKLFPSRDFH